MSGVFLSSCCECARGRKVSWNRGKWNGEETHRDEQRVLAYPLNGLDEQRRELRHRVEDMAEFLRVSSDQPPRARKSKARRTERAAFSAMARSCAFVKFAQYGS